MTTKSLFESFVLDNTIGRDEINPSADYIRKFGNVPFEEAFNAYVEELYKIFVLQNTKARDGINPNAAYFRRYGKVSLEEGFKTYMEELNHFHSLKVKIRKFEDFLIANDVKADYSNISESRYYHYNGVKYRFSSHVYPTGSMTDKILGVVDLAADPELINEVEF